MRGRDKRPEAHAMEPQERGEGEWNLLCLFSFFLLPGDVRQRSSLHGSAGHSRCWCCCCCCCGVRRPARCPACVISLQGRDRRGASSSDGRRGREVGAWGEQWLRRRTHTRCSCCAGGGNVGMHAHDVMRTGGFPFILRCARQSRWAGRLRRAIPCSSSSSFSLAPSCCFVDRCESG